MKHDLRFATARLGARLRLVLPHIHRRTASLEPLRLLELSCPLENPPLDADSDRWPAIEPESYWGRADLNFVLSGSFRVPSGWTADQLALHLPLGTFGDIFNHPEALVYVDGKPFASADRYHHTIPLDPSFADGESHKLLLHGWTGHTGWPPDPSDQRKLFMGRPALVERDPALLAFIRLAQAALDTVSVLPDITSFRDGLLDALDAGLLALDTWELPGAAIHESAPGALSILRKGIKAAGKPLDVTLHAIGHAHLDIAYLWTIDQSRRKAVRTFSNVLRLMEADPNYRFCQSQAYVYASLAKDAPDQFERIRTRVSEGRWEVLGGMWVESDLNIPGPESLVRQLQLGRGYFRDTFGDAETPVLWLPDTFGFPGQVPQLMKQAGLNWFCTNKLNWNQVTRVHPTHLWEGIDGTRVLAHVLTTPRDVEYLPFPTNYKSDLTAREVFGTVTRADPGARHLPICFGYGDGGGGPTEELLSRAHAYAEMPGMPQMVMSSARAAFEAMEAEERPLPVHRGEHYLEGHRGTLTSQAWIKRANRRNERALHEAEALSALAGLLPDLSEAWELLCRNQFHDTISGVCVPQAIQDSRSDHRQIAKLAEAAAKEAADALATNATEPLILNPMPVDATRVAELSDADAAGPMAQPTENGALVYLPFLPAYSAMPLSGATAPPPEGLSVRLESQGEDGAVIENGFLLARFDRFGRLVSAIDKTTGAETLIDGTPANQLQAFEDRPICWDAWDIDPDFENRMEAILEPATFRIIEHGSIRASIRTERRWRKSRICQDIRLIAGSARIDFVTRIDWHQTHTLLKVAFPVAVSSPNALFDIQWGAIERSTGRDTPFDRARFEVPAQKWAMLSDGSRGAALLNDCKYGHDIRGNVMRLTLIKSATSPDPGADQGLHEFTYSFLPVSGNGRAEVDAAAYDLNTPLRIAWPASRYGGSVIDDRPFVRMSGVRTICETLKPAKGGSTILRLFEPDGVGGRVTLRFRTRLGAVYHCDLLDSPIAPVKAEGDSVSLNLAPFEIVTLRVDPPLSSPDQTATD